MPKPAFVRAVAIFLAAGMLGGCAASADVSYGEFRFGEGSGTSRVHESRIYGDTAQGLGGETCRTVARSEIDAAGRRVMRERRVCEGTPEY